MTARIRRTIVESRYPVPPAGMLAAPRLHRWLMPLLFLAGLLVASAAEAQLELYVTNQQGELKTTPPDSVIVYGLASTGDLTFKRILSGPLTNLSVPSGLAVTPDKLFVANRGKCVGTQGDEGFITIYGRTASDDTSPTWIIRGSKTGLNCPFGLVVTDDELFVANQSAAVGQGSITVYKLRDDLGRPTLPNSGGVLDLTPDRTIVGSLSGPGFIAVTDDELFVANNYSGIVTVHDRHANGDQVSRAFRNTGFNPFVDLQGLAVDDARTELFVSHGGFFASTVAVYKPDANGAPIPERALGGGTNLDRASGLVLTGEHVVVASQSTTNTAGSIAVFNRTFSPNAPVRPPHKDTDRLFSPVALAVTQGLFFDYTLKVGNVPPVPRGSVVDVRITAELLAGSGAVTSLSVEGLPGGTGGAFRPTTCPLSCVTTLTITTLASTAAGTSTVTVRARGGPIGCIAPECTVERFVSFPLQVVDVPDSALLEVVKEGDGTCTVTSSPPGIDCGAACLARFPLGTSVRLTATPASDSIFVGWNGGGCVVNNPCDVPVTESTRVTAVCDRAPVPLTVNKAGDGTGTVTSAPLGIACGADCTQEFAINTVVTLTASADPGSRFAGWSGGGCSGTGACTVRLTGPTTVTATFIRIFSLAVVKNGTGSCTVASDPAGISCGPDCSATFDLGTRVTLTASADPGSRFVGWSAAGCTDPSSPCTLTLSAPTTVTATCNLVFPIPLTVVTSGTGTGTVTTVPVGRPCRQPVTEGSCSEFDKDTAVTLTATPGSGSLFAGWSQPADSKLPRCGGAEPCRITIIESTTVNAHFVHTPQEAFIAGLYLNVFGSPPPTPPNPGNVQELIVALTPPPTLTISALTDAFFNGPTFKSRFRGELTPWGYVRVLFRAFLRPEPEPPQPIREPIVKFLFEPLVRQLIGSTVTTGNVLDATLTVLSSDEYEQLRIADISTRSISDDVGLSEDVRRLYRGLLGREPNADEVASAINQLRTRAEDIEDAFVRSAEFQTRFGQLFP